MKTPEASGGLKKIFNAAYWINLPIALLSIAHDLTLQEYIREQQVKGVMKLGTVATFINDNFVGDVGNAFAAVFGVPLVAEVINHEVQKGNANEGVKKLSRFVSFVAPFAMAALFLAGAVDGETNQHIIEWGTPEKGDLVGAIYGTAVALPSILKLRGKVFPRK